MMKKIGIVCGVGLASTINSWVTSDDGEHCVYAIAP